MKYIRTKDGRIIPTNIATHELTQSICDAGYLKILHKGSCVTIGKQWTNFYGSWIDIIDEEGRHYSIRPNEVKEVTRELPQADSIPELCDGDVLFEDGQLKKVHYYREGFGFNEYGSELSANQSVVLFIAIDKGLIYKAKMNDKGELELL